MLAAGAVSILAAVAVRWTAGFPVAAVAATVPSASPDAASTARTARRQSTPGRGRAFTDLDRAPDRPTLPAMVSAAAAALAWPGQDALGKQFQRGSREKPFEVVGIVPDTRTTGIDAPPAAMVYVPYWFRSRAAAALVVRTTSSDPRSLVAAVRRAVQQVDADIAVGESRPLTDLVDAAFAARRYQMMLFLACGAVFLYTGYRMQAGRAKPGGKTPPNT